MFGVGFCNCFWGFSVSERIRHRRSGNSEDNEIDREKERELGRRSRSRKLKGYGGGSKYRQEVRERKKEH